MLAKLKSCAMENVPYMEPEEFLRLPFVKIIPIPSYLIIQNKTWSKRKIPKLYVDPNDTETLNCYECIRHREEDQEHENYYDPPSEDNNNDEDQGNGEPSTKRKCS